MNHLVVECISQQNLSINPINWPYLAFSKHSENLLENQIEKNEFETLKDVVFESNPLPNTVNRILLGSLLGDMHCKKECRNSSIEETHSVSQEDYLIWKYSVLKDYFYLRLNRYNNPICKAKGKIYFRKMEVRLRSRVSEKLNQYHNLFYDGHKKILSQSVLYLLNELALAVWYCDDGYYDPENRTVQIHTEGFSIEENKMVIKWFKERWNIIVNLKKDPSKKRVLLRFPVKESEKFLNLVQMQIFTMPQSIWYKLGHLWEGNTDILNKARLNKSRRTNIYQSKEDVKSKRNEQAKRFYHINREKVLEQKSRCRQTEQYKKYIKDYHQRKDVKARMKDRQRISRQKPEYKEKYRLYQKEYRNRPEAKEKIKEYNKRATEKRKKGDKN